MKTKLLIRPAVVKPVVLTLLAAGILSGCAIAPGPYLDPKRLQDNVTGTETGPVYPVQPITAALIAKLDETPANKPAGMTGVRLSTERTAYEYRVQPQDVLSVTVWNHPELSFASSAAPLPADANGVGATTTPAPLPTSGGADVSPQGERVDPDGTIFFPYVGRVHVAGDTTEQIRAKLVRALSKTVKSPQLDVRVLSYRSQVVQVTGDLKNPGPQPITDVPMTLVDAINRSGGALPDADLQRVNLTRDGKVMHLNANAILERGDVSQNVLLQGGDIVNVPDRSDSRVFVIGEVLKPSALPMNRGHLTLADAIAGVNSIDPKSADPRLVYVIRGARENPTKPTVYRLDMTQVDALLLMTKFQLQPLDVVYVGTASAVRFNRILDQLSPTLQTLFYTRATIDY